MNTLHNSGLTDFHCHCDYSVDAVGAIEDYCEAALQRGLGALCFTTHFDANPGSDGSGNYIRVEGKDLPTSADNLEPYVDNVRRAAEQYLNRGLIVKLGVEIGWYSGCEEMVEKLKQRYAFDHVLCGVHELNNSCFCCSDEYEKCFSQYPEAGHMVEACFKQVVEAAGSGLFDAIAHLDYYRKYGERYYGSALLTAFRPFAQDLFSALRESSTALETNTAGLRKGLAGYFPDPTLINAAKRAGVDVRFLGSDAHRPQDVGFDFDAAVNLLSKLDIACEA